MPKTKTRDAIASAQKPRRFFENQLQGEESLSFQTAERLCGLAAEFLVLHPWEFLGDQDLVLMEDPQSRQTCHCSIMGALGDVFSLHVYVGAESYRVFRKIASGKPITAGDFFASQAAVSVEFVRASELSAPDREVLRWLDYPMRRGGLVPIFRAFRPGYHPWYVTESEGELLARCMQAVIVFCRTMSARDGTFWDQVDVYPLLVSIDEVQTDYEIRMASAPEPPTAPLQLPEVDDGADAVTL